MAVGYYQHPGWSRLELVRIISFLLMRFITQEATFYHTTTDTLFRLSRERQSSPPTHDPLGKNINVTTQQEGSDSAFMTLKTSHSYTGQMAALDFREAPSQLLTSTSHSACINLLQHSPAIH